MTLWDIRHVVQKHLAIALIFLWTIIIGLLMANEIFHNQDHLEESAESTARIALNKDQAFRFWATQHGGVYVPSDERTPPNPHLSNISERDIRTPSGKKLTLMNPAYMLRQMNEEYPELFATEGHITSLKLMRAENAPDPWERRGLESFEHGVQEFSEITELRGSPVYRLMKPMYIEEGCLKCHGDLGYKIGDVRGGISVTVNLESLIAERKSENLSHISLFSFIWFVGCIALYAGGQMRSRQQDQREKYLRNIQESEERFELAMGAAQDGIYDWDLITNEIYYSPTWKSMLGYAEDELPNDFSVWEELTRPEDVIKSWEMQKELINGQRDRFETEFQMLHKDGNWVDIYSRAEAVFDQSGKAIRIVGTHTDISDRVKNTQTILKQQYMFEKAQSLGHIGTWELDLISNELQWTDENCRIFGVAPGTIANYEIFISKVHPSDREYVDSEWAAAIKGKPYKVEHRLLIDGDIRWVMQEAEIEYNEDGKALKAIGFTQDISAFKRSDKRLKDSEALLRESQEIAQIGSYVLDIETGNWNSSQQLDSIFGIDDQFKKDVNGWLQLVHLDDREMMQNHFQIDVLTNHERFNKEYRIKRKNDGRITWVHGMGKLVLDALGSPLKMLGTIQDIHENKTAKEKRVALKAQLHQAQKLEAIGTMVGGISHELNNILQSMFLYGGLVQEELPDKKSLQTNMKHLLEDSERARDIVKQILTFSRKSKVEMKPQFLHDLILEALILEQASLPANVTLKQNIEKSDSMVECDSTQIHQIVLNLCNNAHHAMESTGGILTVSLNQIQASLNSGESKTNVQELKVQDTGHGIDRSDLDKVFDPFFTTKEFGRGTGLGLSVIHGIVEMMQGQITVSSELEQGTTFRILLPVTEKSKPDKQAPQTPLSSDVLNKSILLVDDDTNIREVTQSILIREGFAVESASDGQKAFELFKANPNKYNLIVTDLSMPNMSGIELCQAIRASRSDIPIILSTGKLGVEEQKEYETIGISTSIQKPWTADELVRQIRELDNS